MHIQRFFDGLVDGSGVLSTIGRGVAEALRDAIYAFNGTRKCDCPHRETCWDATYECLSPYCGCDPVALAESPAYDPCDDPGWCRCDAAKEAPLELLLQLARESLGPVGTPELWTITPLGIIHRTLIDDAQSIVFRGELRENSDSSAWQLAVNKCTQTPGALDYARSLVEEILARSYSDAAKIAIVETAIEHFRSALTAELEKCGEAGVLTLDEQVKLAKSVIPKDWQSEKWDAAGVAGRAKFVTIKADGSVTEDLVEESVVLQWL